MNVLLVFLSVVTTALRRLWANRGLALCALTALLTAVALSVSIPVYAEGASLRLLQSELSKQEQKTGRSPFSLMFRYVGGWNGPLEWHNVKKADDYIRGPGLARLQLPLLGLARHVRTDQMRLLLPVASGAENPFLKNVMLGFLEGMDQQIRIVDGERPRPSDSIQQTIEVMIARDLADEIGINVGDEFVLVSSVGGKTVSLSIRIAALWQALNANDPAWFFPPSAFHDVVLVPEATFSGPLAEALKNEVGQVVWFARLSGANLTTNEAAPLLARMQAVRNRAAGVVPGLKLEQSPDEALRLYRKSADELTVQLFVFSVPILGLVFYFAALVAALLVNRQRGEIALFKTRGVRDSQILGIYIVEWLIMGALALALGPSLGLGFASFMGSTRSFLQMADDLPALPLTLTWESVEYGAFAVGLALFAALVPAFFATRRTLVDEQQQAARTVRPPLWQRFYLDVLLLLPPAYGIYQLQRTGGLQLVGARSADPLNNPLLVLLPVLLCFALGLFAVRIIPLLLELLARLAKIPSWIAPLVALRALARQPGNYRGPLLLLILTLSLAAFSASMAATLDGALQQAITYQVGAATQLLETGQSTEQPQGGQQPGGQPSQPSRRDIEKEARWLFVPVTDHLEVPGVTAAARVGTYDATLVLGGVNQDVQLVGIDRVDFPKVVRHFDRDWGDGQSLGALMNLLAERRDGILISKSALEKGLKVGDRISALLSLYGDRREVPFTIVAALDLWPGYYPQDGPIMVANLNYIFDQMGGQYPYDVWIARNADVEVADIVSGVRGLGITVVDARDAAALIAEEQTKPQRQGLFGVLSVGFIAAGMLTLLGFLLSALITARRRAIELGVLRALGLSGWQVAIALIVEQVMLVSAGITAGSAIGLLSAQLVVPLFQIGVGPHPGVPPYPPQIAWSEVTLIYMVFAVALLLTLLALAWILGRMQIFQAIKLGDAN